MKISCLTSWIVTKLKTRYSASSIYSRNKSSVANLPVGWLVCGNQRGDGIFSYPLAGEESRGQGSGQTAWATFSLFLCLTHLQNILLNGKVCMGQHVEDSHENNWCFYNGPTRRLKWVRTTRKLICKAQIVVWVSSNATIVQSWLLCGYFYFKVLVYLFYKKFVSSVVFGKKMKVQKMSSQMKVRARVDWRRLMCKFLSFANQAVICKLYCKQNVDR